jgi:hypothetical protein
VWDRCDPRSDDRDRDDSWDRSFGSRGGTSDRGREDHSRDVFTRDLDLPYGREREQVRAHNRVYEIDGTESRALATIGAFRVLAESDLHDIREVPTLREFAPRFLDGHARANRQKPSGIAAKEMIIRVHPRAPAGSQEA